MPDSGNSPFELSRDGRVLVKYTGEDECVVVPDGVEIIGEGAFEKSGIACVKLPGTLRVIGCAAFRDCASLTSIELPDSLAEIADEAFLRCGLSGTLVFGKGLSVVGREAFAEVSALTEIYFPDVLDTIDARAFSKCTGLQRAVLPRVCKHLGEGVLEGCSELLHLDAPFATISIGDRLLAECKKLMTVSLPSITYMSPKLPHTSILPTSVYRVLVRCDADYAHLLSTNTDGTNADLNFAFNNEILELEIQDGIRLAACSLFTYFPQLLTVILPPSLCVIPPRMFASSPELRTVVFNGRYFDIGENAFSDKAHPVIYAPNAQISTLSKAYRASASAGFFAMLGEGVRLSDSVIDSYNDYFSKESVSLLEELKKYYPLYFKPLARYLTDNELLSLEATKEIIQKGIFGDEAGLLSRLLSYKKEHFGDDGDNLLL